MSDKLASTMAVEVSFVAGEAPTDRKLSAISSQLKRVSSILEQAVGDIRGQSWPYSSSSTTTLAPAWGRKFNTGALVTGSPPARHLDIANLGRLIGPASNLNPYSLSGSRTIVEDIPTGVHEVMLNYPVTGTRSAVDPVVADASLTNWVTGVTELTTAGDYYITANGWLVCFTATAGGTITYTTDPNEYAGGRGYTKGTFNVIPDPNQLGAGGIGCTIGALDGQNRYPVTLPLCTHQQSNIHLKSSILTDEDVNYAEQLEVPTVLQDNFTAGQVIPSGFLYLKNYTTNEVYEDAVYYYDTASTILVGGVSLSDAITSGDVFCIITVGTDITTSIDDLRKKSFHNHNRDQGEPFIDIVNVKGGLVEPGEKGPYVPSDRPGNKFPQYLHRDGYSSTYDANGNDRGSMRGDILFGLVAGTPGSYNSNSGETYGVRFGPNSTSRIYRDSGNEIVFDSSGGVVENGSYFQTTGGIIGPIGAPQPLAPYGINGTFTPPDLWTNILVSTRMTLVTAASINAKSWHNVALAFNPTGDLWVTEHYSNTGSYGFYTEWEEVAGVSTLYWYYNTTPWSSLAGSVAVPYRLTIWYQP